jgi:hypothetical protein
MGQGFLAKSPLTIIRASLADYSSFDTAALIGKSLRTWQNWEAPIESREHRAMDTAFFELFLIKLRETVPGQGREK